MKATKVVLDRPINNLLSMPIFRICGYHRSTPPVAFSPHSSEHTCVYAWQIRSTRFTLNWSCSAFRGLFDPLRRAPGVGRFFGGLGAASSLPCAEIALQHSVQGRRRPAVSSLWALSCVANPSQTPSEPFDNRSTMRVEPTVHRFSQRAGEVRQNSR